MILGNKPFEDPKVTLREYINECVIMSTMYCMIMFTDWIPDIDTQIKMGWVACVIVGGHFVSNVLVIIWGVCR